MRSEYVPPKVWVQKEAAGTWAKINRPVSGATHEQALPVGKHPFQLYSLATPNGQKVGILFEELLAAGVKEAEYDAWLIDIRQGDQFSSGFVALNPNSKIPVLLDRSGDVPVRLFESGHILLYLAEKFDRFLPSSLPERTEVRNWLFWLQGAAPLLGGGFGHFYVYAPEKLEYPIDRYAMEAKRQLHLLDTQLDGRSFIAGDAYTIADMAIWPWYGNLVLGKVYDAAEFLDVSAYPNVQKWAEKLWQRPAVQRGRMVNRISGEPWEQVPERHCATDIDKALQLKP